MMWSRLLASALLFLAGPVIAQASPSAFTTGYRYDQSRQLTGVIQADPDGSGPLGFGAVRNTYDVAGRLIRVESGELSSWQSEAVAPASWTGFAVSKVTDIAYDGLDRKVRETVSTGGQVGGVTQYSYDADGRVVCTAVRMQPTLSLPASACTQTTAQTDDEPDRITRNVYDLAGQLVQVREGVGTSLEVAEATYSYTPSGKRNFVIDAAGNRASLVYDGFDRQTQWTFPSATGPTGYNDSTVAAALSSAGQVNSNDYEAYTYDLNGNRKTLRKRDGRVITFNYDALNRLTSKIIPDGCPPIPPSSGCPQIWATKDVYYAYDLLGHQLEARFDSATGTDRVSNGYNGFGEIEWSEISMAGTTRRLTNQYDASGNRTKLTHPDQVFFSAGYDGLDRMTSASWTTGTGTTPFMAITYDSGGRRSNISRGSAHSGYGYDGLARLTSMNQRFLNNVGNASLTFGYNPASQVTSETRDNDDYAWRDAVALTRPYTTNGLNQYTGAGPKSFTYDANGNLISEPGVTYIYDAENRLVSASDGTELRYDPTGRLWQISKAGAATTFLYDGDELAAEYNQSGVMTWRYYFGPNTDEPILADPGGQLACSGTRFLHGNHQGSIVALADCSGVRQAINTYDEYGIPGSSNQGRFQYTGQAWLSELGLYHYKARLYSPSLGRFLQTDPIGYDDQINLYAYVANDPVNSTDPSGQNKVTWLVETAKGLWKRVSEKQALSSRQAGKNVRAEGPGLVGKGKRLEAKNQGSKAAVRRHEPHRNGNPEHRGTHETHFQGDRKTGDRGHTFVGPPAAGAVAAVTVASAMRDVANEIGTASDNLTEDSSDLERRVAKAWDFVDPASNIADILRVGADFLDPKKEF